MHGAHKLEHAGVCQRVLQVCVIPVGHGVDEHCVWSRCKFCLENVMNTKESEDLERNT